MRPEPEIREALAGLWRHYERTFKQDATSAGHAHELNAAMLKIRECAWTLEWVLGERKDISA